MHYLIGFTPQQVAARYDADVVEWLRAQGVAVETYTGNRAAGPVWRGTPATVPTTSTPHVGSAPAPAQGTPVAPFDGARVTAYATERGNTGFRCYDKALRMSWLYNDHVDMPHVWKARIGAVWYRIDDPTMGRAAMLARTGQVAPVSPVAPVLPFTAPATPARRKARKR